MKLPILAIAFGIMALSSLWFMPSFSIFFLPVWFALLLVSLLFSVGSFPKFPKLAIFEPLTLIGVVCVILYYQLFGMELLLKTMLGWGIGVFIFTAVALPILQKTFGG